jgi:hypothetical protein
MTIKSRMQGFVAAAVVGVIAGVSAHVHETTVTTPRPLYISKSVVTDREGSRPYDMGSVGR